jgi:hypothetical protein
MFRKFTFITQQKNVIYFTRSILSLHDLICCIACNCKYVTHIIIIVIIIIIICLRFCINMYFLQCLPVIYL